MRLKTKFADQARGPILAGLVLFSLSAALPAQISRFPDAQNQDQELEKILSGLGGGSAVRPPRSGVRVESLEVSTDLDRALRTELGYLRWERWWHDRLYEILGSERSTSTISDSLIRRDAVAMLRSSLTIGSLEERRAAAVALARTGAEGIVGDLIFALPESPEAVQASMILALGLSGREEARSYLDAFIRDSRFGRGALGSRSRPVKPELRSVAALALGLLPAHTDCRALHEILVDPANSPADLYLAAALGVGLQSAVAASARDGRKSAFGPVRAVWNPCRANLKTYLELLDVAAVDVRARGALLDALLAAAPDDALVLDKAIDFLSSEKVVLARSAAVALQRVGPTGIERAVDSLWLRVADRSDATASGLALVTIGRIADDEAFSKLVQVEGLNPSLEAYLAFALTEASQNHPQRHIAVVLRLRSLLNSSYEGDQAGLGAIMIAMGLMHDNGSRERIEKIGKTHDTDATRAAALLAASLLNGEHTVLKFQEQLKRGREVSSFFVHDGALALALSGQENAVQELAAVMSTRNDEFSLGGIARAIALAGDSAVIPPLMKLASSIKDSSSSRAFAIGAIGLLLERPDFPMSRLRALSPLPIASPALRAALSHL